MAAFDYSSTQRTALALLQRFGQVIAMTKVSPGTYDPGTGTTTGATTQTQQIQVASVPGSAAQTGLFSDMRKEAMVKGRMRFFLAAAVAPDGSALTFIPGPGVRVTLEGKEWEIFGNTPLSPGGVPVIHEFSAQEGGAS